MDCHRIQRSIILLQRLKIHLVLITPTGSCSFARRPLNSLHFCGNVAITVVGNYWIKAVSAKNTISRFKGTGCCVLLQINDNYSRKADIDNNDNQSWSGISS